MQWIIAFLVYSLAVVVGRKINYCGARMCGNKNTHTFCQYKNGPGPSCNGYMNAKLTNLEKSRILARLNRRRNEAAGGLLRGMPPAGNMMKLRWMEELAKEAQLWADQCTPPNTPEDHDSCRDFYSISVGQCVASVVGEAPGLRVESMVDMWYMQNMLYKGNVTAYIPPDKDRSYYGDFGQMIWFRTFLVGCGRSRFMSMSLGRLRSVERLVCNFAPHGPAPYRMLWSPTIPASACPPRSKPDKALSALCDYQYDLKDSYINNTMTIEEQILLDAVLEVERNEDTDEEGTLDKMYLTNLAVVTMEHPITTSPFISIQKRDIIEKIDIETENVTVYQRIFDPFGDKKFTPSYKRKKKASVVGRPKAYNIDELDENGDDHHEENWEEKLKRDAFYRDYIINEGQEDNKTVLPEFISNSMNLTNMIEDMAVENGTAFINLNETANISDINSILSDSGFLNSVNDVVNNIDSITVNETEVGNEKIDEYLSDPETVKQLQEALDKAETNAAASANHGKVRRDLNLQTDAPSLEEEKNKTLERGPMLNMVLKYMPYLKQYEKELLGQSAGGNGSLRNIASLCPCVSWLMVLLLA